MHLMYLNVVNVGNICDMDPILKKMKNNNDNN